MLRGKFERISEPLSNTIRDTADTARTPFWFSDVRPKRSTEPACNVNSPVYAGVAFESTVTFKPFATLALIVPDGTFPLFQLDGLFQLSFLPPFGALVIVVALREGAGGFDAVAQMHYWPGPLLGQCPTTDWCKGISR